jgi:hypothetical protein
VQLRSASLVANRNAMHGSVRSMESALNTECKAQLLASTFKHA